MNTRIAAAALLMLIGCSKSTTEATPPGPDPQQLRELTPDPARADVPVDGYAKMVAHLNGIDTPLPTVDELKVWPQPATTLTRLASDDTAPDGSRNNALRLLGRLGEGEVLWTVVSAEDTGIVRRKAAMDGIAELPIDQRTAKVDALIALVTHDNAPLAISAARACDNIPAGEAALTKLRPTLPLALHRHVDRILAN